MIKGFEDLNTHYTHFGGKQRRNGQYYNKYNPYLPLRKSITFINIKMSSTHLSLTMHN